MSRNDRKAVTARVIALAMASVSVLAMAAPALAQTASQAEAASTVTVSIPAGPLEQALLALGRQTRLRLAYPSALAAGRTTSGVSGTMSPRNALSTLLGGTGIAFDITGNNVTLSGPGSADGAGVPADGSVVLDTITVSGGRGVAAGIPYETAAPTSYISSEQIERFRGSSPADIFRGTPGVLSGEARNGGGAVDVNIRGMQGMGRVATTIDGAENSLQVYQGYQGLSNRTYVDPDLLSDVEINKGYDPSSSGIAGSVSMRTVSADDIVEDGKTYGLKLKGGFAGNTSTPVAGNRNGYVFTNVPGGNGSAAASPTGLNRPDFLEPTSGSGSAIAAMRTETVDLLAGYAHRKQGNYHAGSNGPAATPLHMGPYTSCNASGFCTSYLDYVTNGGIANYRAGEEVLNTQQETQSFLAKGTVRFGDGHSVQLGYTGYRGEAGSILASAGGTPTAAPGQIRQTTGTKLDTGTFKYRWNPEENDLIDLKANLWITGLQLRNPPRNGFPNWSGLPSYFPGVFRTGSNTIMLGGDVSNRSAFALDSGDLSLDYGVTYRSEDTRPSMYTKQIEGWLNLRDAKREEAATYVKASYSPERWDWLTINGGLRYSHYWSEDRSTNSNPAYINPEPKRDEGGFSPSIGITVEPIDKLQLYANYSSSLRFPSTFEANSAFTIIPNPDLVPERANNWEIGANFRRDGVFSAHDTAMLKLGYFNWNVENYISRAYRAFPGPGYTTYGMQVFNIDKAKFSGLELAARYESGGFAAQFGANYYLDVQFCQPNAACDSKSLYADYATNHVPPEYTVDLTLSQDLLDDRLTVGGRVAHTGPRAIGHGQVTAAGMSQFISQVAWKPFTLVDVFAEYKINETFTASFRVENLFDRYYVDPLGLVQQPGPGRTFSASLTAKF